MSTLSLISTCNIFDPSGPSPYLKDSYNAANVAKTQKQLKQHFGSSLYDTVSSLISTEINTYSSPAAQTMMDVYHHWSLNAKQDKTWNDFINNTSLSHLRSNNMNIFCQLQDYQHHYTSNIYAPLSQYNGNAFQGDASDLVMRLSDVYNHLKLRKTAENCCLQVDVRLTPNKQNDSPVHSNSMQINQFDDDEDESSSDDDDDDEYAIEYAKNLGSKYNFPPKKQAFKMNDFSAASKPKSNISKKAKMETNDLALTNVDNVMRKSMDPLNTEPYSYKRYEMLFDRDMDGHIKSDMVTTFEAISNNTLPSCSFKNSPLCRIWNSTQSTPEIINHLNETESVLDLLTFSYHLLNDCIQIYMFVASGDKLYGSRIFREDLLTTIPSLFENKTVDKHTLEELDTYLEFKVDEIYEEYKDVLLKRNVDDLKDNLENELSDTLRSQLEEFVYSWNNRNSRSRQIDLEQIMEIFIKYKINAAYFENTHRTKFVKLLQRNRIKTCIANQLWLDFGGHLSDNTECKSCMEEKSYSQSISTNSTEISILCDRSPIQLHQIQQSQIQNLQNQLTQKDEKIVRLLQYMQRQKEKLKAQKQELDALRRRQQYFVHDDYKENDDNNISNRSSSSSESSHLDRILIGCNTRLYVFMTQSDSSNDINCESTPETIYVEVESDIDQHDAVQSHNDEVVDIYDGGQHNNNNNQNEDIQCRQIVMDTSNLNDNNNNNNNTEDNVAPNESSLDIDIGQQQQELIDTDDSDDGGIYDDDDNHDQNGQNTDVQDTNPMIRSIQPQYNKWEMMNNRFDAGSRFFHRHLLPEREQRLNAQISATQHTLATIDTRIVMGLFQNAFEIYYVICIYLISIEGAKNLYRMAIRCMINNKWNDLLKLYHLLATSYHSSKKI